MLCTWSLCTSCNGSGSAQHCNHFRGREEEGLGAGMGAPVATLASEWDLDQEDPGLGQEEMGPGHIQCTCTAMWDN